jgi:tripartite-type tricarboxylate transporter receptor subunit TctC
VHEIVAKALRTPEARELYSSQGHEIGGLNPEDYTVFIKAETEKWAQVAQKAGIPKQ